MALHEGCINALTAYDYAFSGRGTVLCTLYLQFYENLLIWWTLFVSTLILYIHGDLPVRIRAKFSSSATEQVLLPFPYFMVICSPLITLFMVTIYRKGKLGNRKVVTQLSSKDDTMQRLAISCVRVLYLGQGKTFSGLTWFWRHKKP